MTITNVTVATSPTTTTTIYVPPAPPPPRPSPPPRPPGSATTTPVATCPSSAVPDGGSCYEGSTLLRNPNTVPPGVCLCTCDADKQNTFAAASSAACTSAVCATAYPSNCANNAKVTTNYTNWADYVMSLPPPTSTPVAAGRVCTTATFTCDAAYVALDDCDSSLLGVVIKQYGSSNLQACPFVSAMLSSVTSISDLTFCATTDCNSPVASSASVRIATLRR